MGGRGFASVVAVFLSAAAGPWACQGQVGTRVVDDSGRAVEGALITARGEGRSVTVYTDDQGRFDPAALSGIASQLEVRSDAGEASPRLVVDLVELGPDYSGDLVLSPAPSGEEPTASSFFAQLPDGDLKRGVVVDCGGCHTFDVLRARAEGRHRTEVEWQASIVKMLALAGPGTGFPIISSAIDPEAHAAWLAESLAEAPWPATRPEPGPARRPAAGALLTEYDVPVPADLPHDVAVDGDRVLVTGMFTHRMYTLDPETGAWDTEDIPVQFANPRAVDVDGEGRWVAVLGAPQSIARFDPGTGEWETHGVGTYPHSVALDSDGRAWYNGHFSTEPEIIGVLDLETGETTVYEVPGPGGESTIPYGLRLGADGIVWGTQLRGNRLVRLDPATGDVRTHDMPTSNSGPRRPDIGPDGRIWIPEFGAGKLAVFDPATEAFREFDFPDKDAGPYVVRVDTSRNRVWIGTGHGDVVASFDPDTEAFTRYVLPTRGALIRHMDIDERTGEVWVAYGASPGIPGKILRIQPGA